MEDSSQRFRCVICGCGNDVGHTTISYTYDLAAKSSRFVGFMCTASESAGACYDALKARDPSLMILDRPVSWLRDVAPDQISAVEWVDGMMGEPWESVDDRLGLIAHVRIVEMTHGVKLIDGMQTTCPKCFKPNADEASAVDCSALERLEGSGDVPKGTVKFLDSRYCWKATGGVCRGGLAEKKDHYIPELERAAIRCGFARIDVTAIAALAGVSTRTASAILSGEEGRGSRKSIARVRAVLGLDPVVTK